MSDMYVAIGHPATTRLHYGIHVELGETEPTREIAHEFGKKIRKEVAENAFALNFSFGVAWKPSELFFAVFRSRDDENPIIASPNWFTRRKVTQEEILAYQMKGSYDENAEEILPETFAEPTAEVEQAFLDSQADRMNGEM